MVETAARLFQSEGYHATSWRRLVAESGTPWGSVHHHFPGGKEELGVAAIELGADAVAAVIDHCFEEHPGDPAAAVTAWFALSAKLMDSSDYSAGCPVATVALETTATSAPLAAASRAAFERWEAALAAHLDDPALAGTLLTLLEGGLVRARVHGSTEPLAEAGRVAAQLVG
jgi:TetR/AcrR family transcriptional repressor of lmrAB and yxaGH operons